MKKIILILFAIITLTSCDEYCPICGRYGDYCTCERNYLGYANGDYFCAETLLGTWQCDYNTVVANMNIKEIKFFGSHKCDITYSEGRETSWYTDTYVYSYVGGYIKFYNNVNGFTFKVDGFLFPELYVRDSFNKYTWRKVKAYGCNN